MSDAWRNPKRELPDSDTLVIIYAPDDPVMKDDPVWLGYHDGESWRVLSDIEPVVRVQLWQPMPEPPEGCRE